jgi:serine/threonine-protein kinase
METIGKYQIQGELGAGGFGKVYRAFDPTVKRPVAIKVLIADKEEGVLPRFRKEATATANLHHKNIVTVYEFAELAGSPYIVMELLEGQDLRSAMRTGVHLSLFERVRILMEVAEGLHYAHQHKVIHRDVKPENVMLLSDGSVKIMDFGIARVMGDDITRTVTAPVIGTLPYMSPEQVDEAAKVDGRTDIWAWGVILYELYEFISGQHPFKASNSAAVIHKIVNTEPTRLYELAPGCPQALSDLVHRAIAKRCDLRYPTMEDLILDCRPILMQLQRGHVVELLTQATSLLEAGTPERADPLLRSILEFDPTNRHARSLRDHIHRVQSPDDEVLPPPADIQTTALLEPLQPARLTPASTPFWVRYRTLIISLFAATLPIVVLVVVLSRSFSTKAPSDGNKLAPTAVTTPPYAGKKRGRFAWTGPLPPKARLVVDPDGVVEGPGEAQPDFNPGVDIAVRTTETGVDVLETPSSLNKYRLVVVSKSAAPIPYIWFSWNVK